MLKIKIPFGFKTMTFDNLYALHTGKIRLKGDYNLISNLLAHLNILVTYNHKGYTLISYVVTDLNVHQSNIQAINAMLARVMHDRIDEKYFPKRNIVPADYGFNDLCF